MFKLGRVSSPWGNLCRHSSRINFKMKTSNLNFKMMNNWFYIDMNYTYYCNWENLELNDIVLTKINDTTPDNKSRKNSKINNLKVTVEKLQGFYSMCTPKKVTLILKRCIKSLMPFKLIKNQNNLHTHLKAKRKGAIMNADLIQKFTWTYWQKVQYCPTISVSRTIWKKEHNQLYNHFFSLIFTMRTEM